MISAALSRLVILVFGTLYPAYSSYKAVRTRNVKEYIKWMMYWIVFALFTCAETFTDVFLSFWFPFYYEIKIILVVYLLSPATKGSSILYRKFVHPALSKREQEIDECIAKAKEQGYHAVLNLGTKGVNYATTILMQTAIKPPLADVTDSMDVESYTERLRTLGKCEMSDCEEEPAYVEPPAAVKKSKPPTRGGGGLIHQIRKSYSLGDLSQNKDKRKESEDEVDEAYEAGERHPKHNTSGYVTRRSSSGSQVDLYFPEVDIRQRNTMTIDEDAPLSHIRSSEDISSGYSSSDPLYTGAKMDSREPLVRTSSVGGRVRTRASSKTIPTRRSTAITEDSLTESADNGVLLRESRLADDDEFYQPLSPNILPTPAGNFILPGYQNMLGSVTPEQLYALLYLNYNNQSQTGMVGGTEDGDGVNGQTKENVDDPLTVPECEDREGKQLTVKTKETSEVFHMPDQTKETDQAKESLGGIVTILKEGGNDSVQPLTRENEKTMETVREVKEILAEDKNELGEKTMETVRKVKETLAEDKNELGEKTMETLAEDKNELGEKTMETLAEDKNEFGEKTMEILAEDKNELGEKTDEIAQAGSDALDFHKPFEKCQVVNFESETSERSLDLLTEDKTNVAATSRASPCRVLRELLEVDKQTCDDNQSIRSGRYRKKQAPLPPPSASPLGSLTNVSMYSLESGSSKSTEYEDSEDYKPVRRTQDTGKSGKADMKSKQKGSVSKIIQMTKLPFSFWSSKPKNDVEVSCAKHTKKDELDDLGDDGSIFIPLKD